MLLAHTGIGIPDMPGCLSGAFGLVGTLVLGWITLCQNLALQDASEKVFMLQWRPVFSVKPVLDQDGRALCLVVRNAGEHAALDMQIRDLCVEGDQGSLRKVPVVSGSSQVLAGGESMEGDASPAAEGMPKHVRLYICCTTQVEERCVYCAEGSTRATRLQACLCPSWIKVEE